MTLYIIWYEKTLFEPFILGPIRLNMMNINYILSPKHQQQLCQNTDLTVYNFIVLTNGPLALAAELCFKIN